MTHALLFNNPVSVTVSTDLVNLLFPRCKHFVSYGLNSFIQVSPRTFLYGKNDVRTSQEVLSATTNKSASTDVVKEKDLDKTSEELYMSGNAIRQRFLEFYASRGHKVLPSASLVPDDPTVLLTIAGMLQFKPIFLGRASRQVARATTAQRCIRTNDVENVGRTSRHHTFFEMLGNFSFGDYFKREAIHWAWELSVKEFMLPAERLWISVFKEDDEAFNIWHDEVGVPKERIKRMGEDDNFWTSGPTGPCGPCSEIYYDFYPERGYANADLGDDSRFIEFYNLVFMEFNKTEAGTLEPLLQKNIDTGLGLERMARILQKVPNNYETDLIYPIIERASELANISYMESDDRTKSHLKVIGDHMRAVVFLISDGVLPSNIGRGYVVRRLIRRAVRTGRLLGIRGDGKGNMEGAFLPVIAEIAIQLATDIDPYVSERSTCILEEIVREEQRFVQTLERGEKLLDQLLRIALSSANENGNRRACLSGKDLFLLYDTYGFPVEITAEAAEECGVSIDMEGFELEMENQRRQSQAAHNVVKLSVGNIVADDSKGIQHTEFLGYETLHALATVEGLMLNGNPVVEVSEGNEVDILLDRTPFYAESGGQVADHGFLYVPVSEDDRGKGTVEIKDVQKSPGNVFIHKGVIKDGTVKVGSKVDATVDSSLRQRAKVHHTATHLLQAALKNVIGPDTSQAGSLVDFDRLRFDFNFHRPLSDHEIMEVEVLVNRWIGDAAHLQTKVMALQDAKNAGAIAMFGEKYEDQVRVVAVPGISMELCGGTHVSNTSEIRGFKVIAEQGIASGIRRIEAVAGEAFIDYVNVRDNLMRNLCTILKVKAEDVPKRVQSLMEELRAARGEVSTLHAQIATYKASAIASRVSSIGSSKIRLLVEYVDDLDNDSLKTAAEYLINTLRDPAAIVLGSFAGEGKVSLVAAFSPQVVSRGIEAGKFIGNIAKMCGGGGGGSPSFAQAGGRKPENLKEALEKARTELIEALSTNAS
ncbi:hypothetical protein AMTR_s00055p00214450 [Amborella trichopoda]|uniref:Probable alanine--tRNA ligase, chloroplastic n=1 Tax=Amborella trichopoda TaxID=13333 RepID=U5CYF0_AMBTC|nr:hypothetical protein AMTR_s00055p00214450 [Amborella trichopoda]